MSSRRGQGEPSSRVLPQSERIPGQGSAGAWARRASLWGLAAGVAICVAGCPSPAPIWVQPTYQVSTLARSWADGLAVDAAGNVYASYSDPGVSRQPALVGILKVDESGGVTAFAGGNAAGYKDGKGQDAEFSGPAGLAFSPSGDLYVADDVRIRKIAPDGTVSTLAGSGTKGDTDGQGASASFETLGGLAVDASGDIYVMQKDGLIRKVTPTGDVTTWQRLQREESSGPGSMCNPCLVGPAPAPGGGVYLAVMQGVGEDRLDNWKGKSYIERIDPSGHVTVVAGGAPGFADGTGTSAKFGPGISGIAADRAGNVYVSDASNFRIRRVSPTGVVRTLAGSGEDVSGSPEGPATEAAIQMPTAIAVGPDGTIYVVDDSILKVAPPS